MGKNDGRAKSGRKPLTDVSNGRRSLKPVKKKTPETEDRGKDDSLDRLLLVQSDLSTLIHQMLAALRSSPDSMSMSSMKDYIDPNLMDLYPRDCLFKMAMLAKYCVDDDPILRPDMKQIVISLSQILLSSVEWEATLAGNSQVFSGLVQGR